MAKRTTKAEIQFWIWLAIIGVPLYGIYALGKTIGWPWFIFGAVSIGGAYIWYGAQKKKSQQAALLEQQEAHRAQRLEQARARRSRLLEKYGDENIVQRIVDGTYWQGQTAEQLRDSLGSPADVDEKVLKTKRKEVWKYHSMGVNRYGLRITLEQDRVVGWDEKL